MTSIDTMIESIRLSFEAGAVKAPSIRVGMLSEEQHTLIDAMHELIARGLMNEHWGLTEAGRAWASN